MRETPGEKNNIDKGARIGNACKCMGSLTTSVNEKLLSD